MINQSNVSTIFVSQKHGCDEITGFRRIEDLLSNGPVKSLEKAIRIVKDMRHFGMQQPVTLRVLDDEYFMSQPLAIDAETTEGQLTIPDGYLGITIEPDTKTLITGGKRVEGFVRDTYNGTECFSADVSEYLAEGLWFTDFFVDGIRADLTHYPQQGTLKPEAVDDNSTELSTHMKWFIAAKEDCKRIMSFKNIDDCFISYNHYWVDEHTPIEGFDPETGRIVCKFRSAFSVSSEFPQSALRYIIENVAEEFKNPNEWYLDRQTKRIYYIPRNESQTPENICAYLPFADKLFSICGTAEKPVSDVCIRGFDMAYTRGDYSSKRMYEGELADFAADLQSCCNAPGSVEMTYARSCSIEDCNLTNLGIYAVNIYEGCKDIRICGNSISHTCAGGISCSGSNDPDNPTSHNSHILISNNEICNVGERYDGCCGILIRHAHNVTISHNEIHDLTYSGISLGWVWGYSFNISTHNIIEYNHIYNVGQGKLSDLGGIYTLGVQKGTVIRNNIIHDVCFGTYGGWGIYNDEGSSYMVVENNIVYNTSSNCYMQHYGAMNTIRNNIFVKSKVEPIKVTRNEMHIAAICENNIMVSEASPISIVGYRAEQRGCVQILASHDNLLYDMKKGSDVTVIQVGDTGYSLEAAQRILNLEQDSQVADPGFADYENNDFTLKPDSPAYKLGFKPIDIKGVGII